ncbi:MAG: trigger factor [Bergeyella sp.]|nr:trigger factor [Bergeyella sp.]
MNVTAKNHDEVSALLTVTLEKKDYANEVEKRLQKYAKSAKVPGFRKGKVPLSLVKRQYEAGIAFEEINKKVSTALNDYVKENNIKLMGQPIPRPTENLDHNAEQLSVSFEIGFEPQLSIDISKYKAPFYRVRPSDKEVDQSVRNMQRRFADKQVVETIHDESHVEAEVTLTSMHNEEKGHVHLPKNIEVSKEQKEAFKLLKAGKVGEVIKFSAEVLGKNQELAKELGISWEEVAHMKKDESVEVRIKEIYVLKLHEVNQELFDKVYGEGIVKSEEELKEKIKVELEDYFKFNSEAYFFNKILEDIIAEQEVKLPEEFLAKWLLSSNENVKTEEEAKEILEKEKEQLKYQIIEGKLIDDHKISIDYVEVMEQAKVAVKNQLVMYGMHNLSDEEIEKYAVEMLKQEEQVRKISSDVKRNKLKAMVLKHAEREYKEVSHEDFLEILKK